MGASRSQRLRGLLRSKCGRLACAGAVVLVLIWATTLGGSSKKRLSLKPAGFPREDAWWQSFHERLAEEVSEADQAEGFGTIFYGDSITEFWRGTSGGGERGELAPNRAVFREIFGKYGGHPLAISGDQVGHLLWRLRHGEQPVKKAPRVIVLLIGTNDLGLARSKVPLVVPGADSAGATGSGNATAAASLAGGSVLYDDRLQEALLAAAKAAVVGVRQAVLRLRTAFPSTAIVVQALLPRGDYDRVTRAPAFEQPSSYARAIAGANEGFRAIAGSVPDAHYVDCGKALLDSAGDLDAALMPDALHPSTLGYRAMGLCLEPVVGKLHNATSRGVGG